MLAEETVVRSSTLLPSNLSAKHSAPLQGYWLLPMVVVQQIEMQFAGCLWRKTTEWLKMASSPISALEILIDLSRRVKMFNVSSRLSRDASPTSLVSLVSPLRQENCTRISKRS